MKVLNIHEVDDGTSGQPVDEVAGGPADDQPEGEDHRARGAAGASLPDLVMPWPN